MPSRNTGIGLAGTRLGECRAEEWSNQMQSLVLRGKRISEDANGHICLDDIWALSGQKATKQPTRWRATALAKSLIIALEQKIAISSIKENKPRVPTVYAKRGRGNVGTYAHPILAAAYAGYLSPKLEIEVREIWLRYRAGDATLADEILTARDGRGKSVGWRAGSLPQPACRLYRRP